MDLLQGAERTARFTPERVAHTWRGESLTYGELWDRSGRLAASLSGFPPGAPIVVHGHKRGLMLVCFLAAVRSGHPYVPVDSSLPRGRLTDIIGASDAACVLAVDQVGFAPRSPVISRSAIEAIVLDTQVTSVDPSSAVGPDDPFYIIYTSGSTGSPKGVQISRRSVGLLAEWALTLIPPSPEGSGPEVFLNQAPFSFDLSVFELAMGLVSGATIVSVDKQHVAHLSTLFDGLEGAGLTVWVSTPSFADLCLADPRFTGALLPELKVFLFCGETLANETARTLRERFPDASVVNTYGPTESTVAVTSVVCTDDVIRDNPILPVGSAKSGTRILIRDAAGQVLPERETGEIVIVGDTVSLGYHGRPDLTASVFEWIDGERAYRTGDAGQLRDGILHFSGRLDFQVKVHGYRIELEDVEANLRTLPGISHAVVLPVQKPDAPGNVSHLQAFVQLSGDLPERPLSRMIELKRELGRLLPDYMIPKVFTFVEAIPLTANGKADRQALRAMR